MLPARHRLTDSLDFAAAVRGARAGSRILVVHASRAGSRAGRPPRAGVAVSRAVGNAVVRNRTKRRLRALLAARMTALPDGVDLVVRANPPAAQASSAEFATQLDRLVPRVLESVRSARPSAPRSPACSGGR